METFHVCVTHSLGTLLNVKANMSMLLEHRDMYKIAISCHLHSLLQQQISTSDTLYREQYVAIKSNVHDIRKQTAVVLCSTYTDSFMYNCMCVVEREYVL